MKKAFISIFLIIFIFSFQNAFAEKSKIIEAEGTACMGDDKSKKDAEAASLADAKRNAVESVKTVIVSESKMENLQLVKDTISGFSQANVELVGKPEYEPYNDAVSGSCIKAKIKAIVTPSEQDNKKLDTALQNESLDVSIRTDKQKYKDGEFVKIFIKGNKDFYGRVIYKGASGNILQLFPNPYSSSKNHFKANIEYEIPSKEDKFKLQISEPFGEEEITVYASPSKLGDVLVEPIKSENGKVYRVKEDSPKTIQDKSRDIKIVSTDSTDSTNLTKRSKKPKIGEFFEDKRIITTTQK